MALYLVRSDLVLNPPRGSEAAQRHGQRVRSLLRAAGLAAQWREVRTSWTSRGVVDVIDAPDEGTAQAAADLIALTHASLELAA